MFKHPAYLAAGLVLASVSHVASAGLLGTSVYHCADSAYAGLVTADPGACDPATVQPIPPLAVVGDGVEFSVPENRFLDFADDTLTIRYVQPVGSPSPDLFMFTLQRPVTSVSLAGANPLAVSWTFSGNRLGILIDAPLVDASVTLSVATPAVAVAEPGSLALAAMALLALAVWPRRRCRRWRRYSSAGAGTGYWFPL